MEKSAVVAAIREALAQEFASYLAVSKQTRAAGNDAHTKAEGKYDTRSTEENYLADGQAKQALLAREALAAFDALPVVAFAAQTPITLGALVELAFPTENLWFFLAPAAGGLEVTVGQQVITLITPESPLGQQLKGRCQGDTTTQPKTKIRRVC